MAVSPVLLIGGGVMAFFILQGYRGPSGFNRGGFAGQRSSGGGGGGSANPHISAPVATGLQAVGMPELTTETRNAPVALVPGTRAPIFSAPPIQKQPPITRAPVTHAPVTHAPIRRFAFSAPTIPTPNRDTFTPINETLTPITRPIYAPPTPRSETQPPPPPPTPTPISPVHETPYKPPTENITYGGPRPIRDTTPIGEPNNQGTYQIANPIIPQEYVDSAPANSRTVFPEGATAYVNETAPDIILASHLDPLYEGGPNPAPTLNQATLDFLKYRQRVGL